jgi:hypothetical protein
MRTVPIRLAARPLDGDPAGNHNGGMIAFDPTASDRRDGGRPVI